ncbi:Protein NDRG3-like protein [Leptotrombidium deliense]|uniref:Protein NDRG3-like protein n=1 Tax=Leptotrombidium deliense TaxID=299467 RepID=A0A443SGE9_9ACAR|nr:Protein NDRG3-like protein [Leptotrombidium deliense]
MPIYYKKVQRYSSDAVRFVDSRKRFSVGTKSKINSKKDSIEMSSINIQMEAASPLIASPSISADMCCKEELIDTRFGPLLVARQGADHLKGKPIILTYHDIGFNYLANFEEFFNFPDNKILLHSFAVVHINAPGQHMDRLPADYIYPTIEQLTAQIQDVIDYFQIKTFVGIGQGLGANLLSRFALLNPNAVDGLLLLNPTFGTSSWSEWFYQRKNVRVLLNENDSSLLPQIVQDYFLWYHFGRESAERDDASRNVIEIFRGFYRGMSLNSYNLGLLIESYLKRTPIAIERNGLNFKCQVLVMSGSLSPHVDETLSVISRLDPKHSSWLKLNGCAMVLEEKPDKVAEAFRLFLQGLGYTLKAYERRRALMSGLSLPCLTSVGTSLSTRRMTDTIDFV